jgi:hypothetical protein
MTAQRNSARREVSELGKLCSQISIETQRIKNKSLNFIFDGCGLRDHPTQARIDVETCKSIRHPALRT